MHKYDELVKRVIDFRNERDWGQFHTLSNLAKSVSIEAGELLECFQWSDENYSLEDVKDEMSDVFVYLIHMADRLNIDLIDAANAKMDKNAAKYPVEKAKGNATKYDKL